MEAIWNLVSMEQNPRAEGEWKEREAWEQDGHWILREE